MGAWFSNILTLVLTSAFSNFINKRWEELKGWAASLWQKKTLAKELKKEEARLNESSEKYIEETKKAGDNTDEQVSAADDFFDSRR